ncbi:MAG: cupin domain-containing protein [Planctomycetota bacterium]
MSEQHPYSIHTDVSCGPLERMDIQALAEACKEPWFNQTLCRVNDCVVRLGIIQGEFHWHHHDDEDEFFYVVQGRLLIDLEEESPDSGTVELGEKQAFTVPRGVRHRTRAPERTVILMVEGSGVTPTGD